MPKCKPCLGRDIKAAILKEVTDEAVVALLERVADCAEATAIELCGAGVRARSRYQQFVSECMVSKHLKGFDPEAMKDCARQWKQRGG